MGSFAVQLARELGARVLAAGRDRDRLEQLRDLGVEEICVAGTHLPQQVREATGGRGVDLVLDFVGGPELRQPPGVAAREAAGWCWLGCSRGRKAELEPRAPILKRRLRDGLRAPPALPRRRRRASSPTSTPSPCRGCKDGRLRPVVDRVVPFERAAEAYKALERGGVFGKIVLEMS